MAGYGFSKGMRLLKRREFLRLSAKNQKVANQHFLVLFDANDVGYPRLGVTVTKRVGNAVIRNRLKRHVREYFRRNQGSIHASLDLNVIPKVGTSDISSEEVTKSLQLLFGKLRKNR